MKDNFPGGSKKKVNKAGDSVRTGCLTNDDLNTIDTWRAAHRPVLNTFQALLRTRTRNSQIIVAQRHKRRSTIFDKLNRFPSMQLARMDDVVGCRLIFKDLNSLQKFRIKFHKARFKHTRKNSDDKYDYIKKPKVTGYRGIHDVYKYDVNSMQGRDLKGLMVEIQYRTLIQHAWATTVEVIGLITESQPKFQKGDKRYEQAMIYASEILARSHEDITGPLPHIDNKNLVENFNKLDMELNLINTLNGLNISEVIHSKKPNAILIFNSQGELTVKSYKNAPEALRELFKLEKEEPSSDIVLVRADTNEDVRLAYKNYFSDATDFISLIKEGCEKLNQ